MLKAPNHGLRHSRSWLFAALAIALIVGALTTTATAQDLDSALDDPPSSRIVNGVVAELGDVPHQVAILEDGEPVCGGSIVGPTTVVTAAHCVLTGPTYQIRAGVLDENDPSGQDRFVARVVSHPAFARTGTPDVAVLQLASALDFNEVVAPVGLATADDVVAGSIATISGWGALAEPPSDGPGEYPGVLLRATAVIQSDAECSAVLTEFVPALEVCTTSMPSGPCFGDSGGPLTVGSGSDLRLVGAVSWGRICGSTFPSVYADIAATSDWIIANATETLSGTLEGTTSPTTCNGRAVTVDLASGDVPTSGPDVIAGTSGDDIIGGGDGDDVICGFGGNDIIYGQAGDDTIIGGNGDDKLRGGAGNDVIRGGDGADDLSGSTGDDEVYGGAGDDVKVRGGTGVDIVDGGSGNDALVAGNGGEDRVFGGDGNDKVTGGPRPDQVAGQDGNDEVRGNKGADVLLGGNGDDMIFGGPQPDQIDGGAGTDTCNGGTNDGAVDNDAATGCEGTLVNIP